MNTPAFAHVGRIKINGHTAGTLTKDEIRAFVAEKGAGLVRYWIRERYLRFYIGKSMAGRFTVKEEIPASLRRYRRAMGAR